MRNFIVIALLIVPNTAFNSLDETEFLKIVSPISNIALASNPGSTFSSLFVSWLKITFRPIATTSTPSKLCVKSIIVVTILMSFISKVWVVTKGY